MSGTSRLDFRWWKKNRPNSLRQGSVESALEDFEKVNKAVEKNHQYGLLFKSLGKLKAAIAKDAQVLRKAKDKEALKFLADFEKLAHSKVQAKQKHLSLSGISHAGLKPCSGVKTEQAQDSGSDVRIVRTGDSGWQPVKADKAVSSAKSKKVHALPKGVNAKSLSGWKKEQLRWSCIAESDAKATVVTVRLMLEYEWGGKHPDQGGGAYLANCSLWATDLRIAGGYSADVEVEIKKAWNSGSKTVPVAAVALAVTAKVTSELDKLSKTWVIECHGNNQRDIK